jgi:hypothetical protein
VQEVLSLNLVGYKETVGATIRVVFESYLGDSTCTDSSASIYTDAGDTDA